MGLPLAYFLTWTCYGQRVHGDTRRSVDRSHNAFGTPLLAPDATRERREREVMSGPPFSMTSEMRKLAARTIEELCNDRLWRLIARNPRQSHVHVVVNCGGEISPERVMADFKARITKEFRRAGLVGKTDRLWTRHGSTRWLNHENGLSAAIMYTNDWQSGVNGKIKEERKREVRERIEALRVWLRERGLPVDGKTVVVGEREEERKVRVNEPRTQ